MNPFDRITLISQRGQERLVHESRLYRFLRQRINNDGSESEYWVCCVATCLGRLTIRKTIVQGFEDREIICSEDSHTACVADYNELTRQRALIYLDDLVSNNHMPLREAVAQTMTLLRGIIGHMEAAQFPTAIDLQRGMNRRLRRSMGSPPNSLDELNEIPASLQMTLNGERFMIGFSYFREANGEENGPIVLFATKDDLLGLFNAELNVGDGTFKSKPRGYSQIRGAQVQNVFIKILII